MQAAHKANTKDQIFLKKHKDFMTFFMGGLVLLSGIGLATAGAITAATLVGIPVVFIGGVLISMGSSLMLDSVIEGVTEYLHKRKFNNTADIIGVLGGLFIMATSLTCFVLLVPICPFLVHTVLDVIKTGISLTFESSASLLRRAATFMSNTSLGKFLKNKWKTSFIYEWFVSVNLIDPKFIDPQSLKLLNYIKNKAKVVATFLFEKKVIGNNIKMLMGLGLIIGGILMLTVGAGSTVGIGPASIPLMGIAIPMIISGSYLFVSGAVSNTIHLIKKAWPTIKSYLPKRLTTISLSTDNQHSAKNTAIAVANFALGACMFKAGVAVMLLASDVTEIAAPLMISGGLLMFSAGGDILRNTASNFHKTFLSIKAKLKRGRDKKGASEEGEIKKEGRINTPNSLNGLLLEGKKRTQVTPTQSDTSHLSAEKEAPSKVLTGKGDVHDKESNRTPAHNKDEPNITPGKSLNEEEIVSVRSSTKTYNKKQQTREGDSKSAHHERMGSDTRHRIK